MIESRRYNHYTVPAPVVTQLIFAALVFILLFGCLLLEAFL